MQDRIAAFQLLATMYIKYIQIFRRLEQSYDQVVHPQKRRVLRHVLDGVMGRVLELKNEMVNLELCEYHYFDDVLSDLKLTPVCRENRSVLSAVNAQKLTVDYLFWIRRVVQQIAKNCAIECLLFSFNEMLYIYQIIYVADN